MAGICPVADDKAACIPSITLAPGTLQQQVSRVAHQVPSCHADKVFPGVNVWTISEP